MTIKNKLKEIGKTGLLLCLGYSPLAYSADNHKQDYPIVFIDEYETGTLNSFGVSTHMADSVLSGYSKYDPTMTRQRDLMDKFAAVKPIQLKKPYNEVKMYLRFPSYEGGHSGLDLALAGIPAKKAYKFNTDFSAYDIIFFSDRGYLDRVDEINRDEKILHRLRDLGINQIRDLRISQIEKDEKVRDSLEYKNLSAGDQVLYSMIQKLDQRVAWKYSAFDVIELPRGKFLDLIIQNLKGEISCKELKGISMKMYLEEVLHQEDLEDRRDSVRGRYH